MREHVSLWGWAAHTYSQAPLALTSPASSEAIPLDGFRRQDDDRLDNCFIFQKTGLSKKKPISEEGSVSRAWLSFFSYTEQCTVLKRLVFQMAGAVTIHQDGLCMFYGTFKKPAVL